MQEFILKTIRFRKDIFESIEAISKERNCDFNTICQEAIEEWLQSISQEEIARAIEDEAYQSRLDYDEFWDGVELD